MPERPPDLPAAWPDGWPAGWATGLREEVRRVSTAAGSRRTLPGRAWLGRPGGADDDVLLLPDPPPGLSTAATAGLRADLVERALDASDPGAPVLCWVTRSGELGAGDLELAWWAAARHAFARHDRALTGFCVLNRVGWTDLVSGAGRTWARVRPRPRD